MNPQPGWYTDPDRPGWVRWWDGRQWTDQRAPAPSAASPTRHRSPARSFIAAAVAVAVVVAVGGGWYLATRGGDGDDVVRPSSDDGSADGEPLDPVDAGWDDDGDVVPRGNRLIDTCGVSGMLGVPGTDIEIEPLSLEQEARIGDETVAQVLSTYRVSGDNRTQGMLEGLLDDLRPPDSSVNYRVTLLDSDEVNAFAVPGGSIFFTTAITALMNEDELAFVMGHEIAHVHCRHIAQEIERVGLVAAAANAVFGTELDAQDIYADAAGSAIAELASLSFSRDDELESDLASLDLLEAAGRPLGAAVDALETLHSLEGSYQPDSIDVLLSTHPPTQERIDAVDEAVNDR